MGDPWGTLKIKMFSLIFDYCPECSFNCITEDDARWQPMCNHPLNAGGSLNQDRLLGMEECKSPFGIYELKIPVDKNLKCKDTGIKSTNCKDLDVSYKEINLFTLKTSFKECFDVATVG